MNLLMPRSGFYENNLLYVGLINCEFVQLFNVFNPYLTHLTYLAAIRYRMYSKHL
jgi:hypothetical protein